MSTLNTDQAAAARRLLEARPPVLPGTRAILNRPRAIAWYHAVSSAMVAWGVKDPDQVREFCDLAGVAD